MQQKVNIRAKQGTEVGFPNWVQLTNDEAIVICNPERLIEVGEIVSDGTVAGALTYDVLNVENMGEAKGDWSKFEFTPVKQRLSLSLRP